MMFAELSTRKNWRRVRLHFSICRDDAMVSFLGLILEFWNEETALMRTRGQNYTERWSCISTKFLKHKRLLRLQNTPFGSLGFGALP